jgi:hypothetical protein
MNEVSQLSETSASTLSHQLAHEVKVRAAQRLAEPYDASSYAWKSDGKVGNTLVEIEEIRAYGYPLGKAQRIGLGDIRFRDYQYELGKGFLKGSHTWRENKHVEDKGYSEIDYLYAEPPTVQETWLIGQGYAEVVHNVHGRGFLLESPQDSPIVKVYFMDLPGSTPSCHHGANIRWVKRSNLL